MAMSNAGMSAAIKAELDSQYGAATGAGVGERQKFCDAVAKAVVEYIQASAVVNPGSMAIVPASIIAPPGGGPCAGVGTVATGTGTVG